MKLQAELNKAQHSIEIKREGEKVFATVDGREYELEADRPEPNIYLLKHQGKIYQFFISPRLNTAQPFSVAVGDKNLEIKIFDPKKLRSSPPLAGHADGIAEIKTAMPGKVVRILVETGTTISAGEGVLVVEAMKMQNELKAPKDGVVKEIRFKEGETVNAGDILAVIE